MRVAIIGSGTVKSDISQYIPKSLTELIICGEETEKIERWARRRKIPKLTISSGKSFRLPPKKLAKTITEIADIVIVVGSTLSPEARILADSARKAGKSVRIHVAPVTLAYRSRALHISAVFEHYN